MIIKVFDRPSLKLNFTDKVMSSYGGFLTISKFLDQLDFKSSIQKIIPFTETSPNSKGGVYSKVVRLGLTVLSGGNRYSHSLVLGDNMEFYEKSFRVDKIPKSITAVTRFINKFSRQSFAEKLQENLWEYQFNEVIVVDANEDILTFDSTVLTRYGIKQEGVRKGYNPKKRGRASHHPIIAFLNRSRFAVNLWNRMGDRPSNDRIVEFANKTFDRLDGKIKITGCLADSGYYDIEFIKLLEAKEIEFVIAAKLYKTIQNEVYSLKKEKWKELSEGISIAEFDFMHPNNKEWTKKRRYIVVRQSTEILHSPKGKQLSLFPEEDKKEISYRYGVYCTSSKKDPVEVWRTYRLRADDENRIKEYKQDFALEGFVSQSFFATEVSMLLRILFYNLFNLFRQKALPVSLKNSSLDSVRRRLFIIPAILGTDGKTPIVRMAIKQEKIKNVILNIFEEIDNYFAKRIALKKSNSSPEVAGLDSS